MIIFLQLIAKKSQIQQKSIASYLTADPEVYTEPEKYFDQVIEINLSELETIYKWTIYTRF